MIFYPLYIDPGTGSAVFSIIIGLVAAGYFLLRSLILKLKVVLFRKNDLSASLFKYVIFAEDKRYFPFFELIINEFENREIELIYLTTSKDDPVFDLEYKFIKAKYIGEGNKAYAFLNFLCAEFVLATTPQLDVFQWKRSKNVKHYSHIYHMPGGSLLYNLFALDYYDSILVPSDIEISENRCLEKIRNLPEKQIITVGNTFFDRYIVKINELKKEENHRFTVLVSPSWGPAALLKTFGEKLLDPLAETGWRIIIRPHPQSVIVEKQMLDKLYERYKNNSNIEWDYNHENIYSLSKSDVMISDFSGIIYDYIFMFDKPVICHLNKIDFRRMDAHDVDFEPYYYQAFKKVGIQLDESNLSNIKETILSISQDEKLSNIRQEIKKTMWQYQGESAKRITDFMIKTCKEEN